MIHRKHKLIAVLCAGYLGLLLCPASAQPALHRQPLAEQQPFTESEAVAYGLVHNPGLRAQRSFIGVIEGEVINEAILQDAIIGAAVEREREREREVGEDDETSIARSRRFAASQGFGIAAQRPFEILAARAELDAVRLELAEAEIDLVREIKSVIAEYLAATDLIAEVHNVIYKAKPLMWEATAGKPNERRRILMGFLFFQQSFPENSLERLEAETELNNLLGLPPDTRLYITGNLDPEPLPISYEELTQSIFSRSVELRVALAELRAARFGLELAMRDKVPEVEVEYSNRRVRGESGKVVRSSETGIGAGLNLFRQFVEQNRGEVYSANKAVEAA
ncbi:TolC family protein, partial [Candidatus Sumerlaeota bacterium]|nr:TolC family protein [Candidatus Sumerlaeota bacterium]